MSIVDNERQKEYGDPRPNFERIAGLWSAYLGITISPHDCAMLLVLMKCSRMKANPHHADSAVDAAGYLLIAERLK